MQYAEVAVDFPDDRARLFTYSVLDGSGVHVGDAVRVPFGPQVLNGIVFDLAGQLPAGPGVEVLSLQGTSRRALTPQQIAVARWIALYYRSTYFAAASLMVPPGSLSKARVWLTVAPGQPAGGQTLTPGESRAVGMVEARKRMGRSQLVRRLGSGGEGIVDRLVRRGVLQAAVSNTAPYRRATADILRLALPASDAVAAAATLKGARNRKRAELLLALAAGPSEIRKTVAVRQFGKAAVDALVALGLVSVNSETVRRDPLSAYSVQQGFAPDLTPDQADAVAAIVSALEAPANGPRAARFLLFGVTGSGKTEVYVRAAEACVSSGRQVIVLTPEIALTPQLLGRFAARFPGRVALLHSGLTKSQRLDQWEECRAGGYDVVIGSRSAVFAPLDRLGLIVLDEEHEWTFKQADPSPRYHARDVAERLCAESGAVLVAGSATPDIETFRRATRGDYRLLRMPRRLQPGSPWAAGAAVPETSVEVVDMREELRAGHIEPLSRRLIAALRETTETGGKAVLFINRRGSASFVQCRDCGTVRKCARCDTTLTHHRPRDRSEPGSMVCHYCGYRVSSRRACGVCGGTNMLRLGPGTQAIAEAVQGYFPRIGVVRWDSDVAKTAAQHEQILRQFSEGKARVLVGTQLVAKGHDIPSVTLVGIVAADVGLSVPDYRAAERTFQLITQAAGRAGRGSHPGTVIVQTFQPDHHAVRAGAARDYQAFYDAEIPVRAQYAFPPFTRLVRLTCADPDGLAANRLARDYAAALRHAADAGGDSHIEVSGPTPAYPHRLRGRWRWSLTIKGPDPARLLDSAPPGRGWAVDVDPVTSGQS
jgi:primosomal protein N' (replication factor Y)